MALEHGGSVTRAQKSAAWVRAAWLADLQSGKVDVLEAIRFAATLQGRPLRAMRVETVLAAQPEWTPRQARVAVSLIHREAGRPGDCRPLTVGSLLDRRRRLTRPFHAATSRDLGRFPFRVIAGEE